MYNFYTKYTFTSNFYKKNLFLLYYAAAQPMIIHFLFLYFYKQKLAEAP